MYSEMIDTMDRGTMLYMIDLEKERADGLARENSEILQNNSELKQINIGLMQESAEKDKTIAEMEEVIAALKARIESFDPDKTEK